MKKSEIKKIFSIVLMILILLFTTKVNAVTDKFDTTLRASDTEVRRESNVTITIGLENIEIESGEKGIGAYTAHIEFDPAVLEFVETNKTSKWKEPSYLNGNIASTTQDGEVVSDAQDIGSITFKVKEDARLGKTTISLINFSGTTVATEVTAPDKSIEITILDKNGNGSGNEPGSGDSSGDTNKPGGGSGNTGTGNKPNGGNGSSDTNKPNSGNDNNGNNDNNDNNPSENPGISNVIDNSTKPGTLPQTGEINMIVPMVIVISILSGIACFMGIKVFKGSAKH